MIVDAGVLLRTRDNRWEVDAIGKNMTNEQYLLGVAGRPGYGALSRTVELQPGVISASLNLH